MSLTVPEKTGVKREPPVEFRFQPGNPGRPKGSKNKLGEAFVAALHEDFQEHGVRVIEAVRTEKPDVYLKVIAQIIPREFTINTDAFDGVSDEQLAIIVAAARSALGVIEGRAEDITGAGSREQVEVLPALQKAK
jgi:hypothetical protein